FDDALAEALKSGVPRRRFAGCANEIVWAAFAIANVRDTLGAGAYAALPGCEAVRVHDPAPVTWTFAPATVQLPAAETDTGRPDEAVAAMVKSASPYVLSEIGAKAIVCASGAAGAAVTVTGARAVTPPAAATTFPVPAFGPAV